MPVPEPERLGSLLRRYRRAAALSQDELASRSGVSARTISDLERGQRPSAHFETLRLLADALALAPADRARLIRVAQGPRIDVTLHRLPVGDAPQRGLPAAATKLIGREREVAEIAGELMTEGTRLLTLTGPGGVGKTRLALAAAAASDFPSGVACIDLAPVLDPDAVLPAIARGFDLDVAGPEAIEGLRAVFDDRRFLLVLDNFEQVISAATGIAALLAASPALTVLVTSRAPLRVRAEREYPVSPMALPDRAATVREIQNAESVRLFVDRALAGQRDVALGSEQLAVVAQICRHLDGLPLAIELAASRLSLFSPGDLLDRLEQRLPLLTQGARDAPPRQQTMGDAIAWSYNLLDPTAQRLFRLLSVFVGGFSLDTVEWLIGKQAANGVAAVDTLAMLVDSSLVVRASSGTDGARFSMYETIREFGLAQLGEQQELQHAYGLLTAFCQRLTHFGDDIPNCIVPAPWLAIMDQERGNIRAAHHCLTQSDEHDRLFEFTVAFGHYLYNRGPIQEAWSWIEQALAVAPSQPASLQLQALYWASHLSSHLGWPERAMALATEALQLAQECGDPSWRAAIVHCLAIVQDGCEHHDEATALFEEELRLWEEAGVQGLSGFALMCLGGIAFTKGDLVAARSLQHRAADIFVEMGGFGWLAVTKWLCGLCAASEGDLLDAAAQFHESLRLSVDHKTSMIHHKGLIGLACVASELTLHDRASHLIGAADACLEPTGQRLYRFEQIMYNGAVAVCRSALGMAGFESMRRQGAASAPAAWVEHGAVIRRAARRVSDGGATRQGSLLEFRSHPAAD